MIALGSILVLAPSIWTRTTALAAPFALALLGVYLPLVKFNDPEKDFSDTGMSLTMIKSVVLRTLPLLLFTASFKAWLDPPKYVTISRVLLPGFFKAIHWIILFIAVSRIFRR